MNKIDIRSAVLPPGEYETCINKVSATETSIRIHVLAFEPDGRQCEDVYENFDFRTSRSLALGEKVMQILNISKSEFARRFDSNELENVASKLDKELAGCEVKVRIAGTMVYYASDNGNPAVFTKHVVEIIGKEVKK